MAAVITVTAAKSHLTNKNNSELFALLSQRLPPLAPNPQKRKAEEETMKISFLESLIRNICVELGGMTRDLVLHIKNENLRPSEVVSTNSTEKHKLYLVYRKI